MNREIFLEKNAPIAPLQWVYGTNGLTIGFEILDSDASKISTVKFYSKTASGVRYSAAGTKNGQIVSFKPESGFFAVGHNTLQCELVTSSGTIYSFAVTVYCEPNNKFEGAEQDPVALAAYIEQINKNTADIAEIKKNGVSNGPTKEELLDIVEEHFRDHPVSGGGVSSATINLFEQIGKKLMFKDETGKLMWDSLVASMRTGGGSSDEPDTPTDPTPDDPDEPTVTTYTVTFVGTGCSSDGASKAEEGKAYSCSITPQGNYSITEVTVMMGGSVITGVYSDGIVSIASVTGDIIINAIAMGSDNLIDMSKAGAGALADGSQADGVDYVITDYIPVVDGKTYKSNMARNVNGTADWNQKIEFYDANKTKLKTTQIASAYNVAEGSIHNVTMAEGNAFVRIKLKLGYQYPPYFGESGVL